MAHALASRKLSKGRRHRNQPGMAVWDGWDSTCVRQIVDGDVALVLTVPQLSTLAAVRARGSTVSLRHARDRNLGHCRRHLVFGGVPQVRRPRDEIEEDAATARKRTASNRSARRRPGAGPVPAWTKRRRKYCWAVRRRASKAGASVFSSASAVRRTGVSHVDPRSCVGEIPATLPRGCSHSRCHRLAGRPCWAPSEASGRASAPAS